eukprot:scaffold2863_cov123-Isochrysis_galbana.AAC.1
MGGRKESVRTAKGQRVSRRVAAREGRLHKALPGHYWLQVNALLEITGRKWCDYVCWAPA